MNAEPGEELAVPLLARQEEDEAEEQQQDPEIASTAAAAEPEAAADEPQHGDVEQGLTAAAGSEAGGSNRAEDESAYEVSRFTMHAD